MFHQTQHSEYILPQTDTAKPALHGKNRMREQTLEGNIADSVERELITKLILLIDTFLNE